MSLSADTKDALAREIPQSDHCRQALLQGLALYGRTADAQYFITQRNAVAKRQRRRTDLGQIRAVGHVTLIRGSMTPYRTSTMKFTTM